MFGDKLKILVKNKNEEKNGNDKKKIENLVFFIIILIITVFIINYIWNDGNKSNSITNNISNKELASQFDDNLKDDNNSSIDLGSNLEMILSKIQGVGDVKVFLNYSESTETVAMYNENSKTSVTEETDTSGGSRKKEETDNDKEIVYQENNGNKTPIIQKTIQPKIEGAIITAKGAGNANIKKNIIEAVVAATGLAPHKIQVFEMN